jgi:hypothetical protein
MNIFEQNEDKPIAIWKLIEQCAKELTENGISPFTRIDIIKCVQSKNSSYGPDSINPIIQGLTDNLQGGAPGAVGKNILHSVGRGLFVLRGQNQGNKPQEKDFQIKKPIDTALKNIDSSIAENPLIRISNNKVHRIGSYDFLYICKIEPEREPNWVVRPFMPQSMFENINKVALNKYGKGPFCKFKIPRNLEYPGVYGLMEKKEIKYIGECAGLSSRYNMGYGNISPRNCFVGGQETNFRINNLIFQQISAGLEISLWFFYTLNYKSIENQLRALLLPSCNRI